MEAPDSKDRPAAEAAPAEVYHEAGVPVTRPDPIASLRRPDYLLYLVGSVLSNTGNQMRTVAIGWEVYTRTHQPFTLGLVGLTLALPVLLLALPAGAAADRYPRKTLIMIAQAGLAVCGLGLAWASYTKAPLPLFYVLLLGTGIFRTVGWPASQAIVTGLVPAAIFPNATMWRSMAYEASATVGPLLGGALLATMGTAPVYVLDASSSLILMGCLLFIHPAPQARPKETRSWRSLLEGARFVRRQPMILSTITLDMIAVLFGGATALLPIYATDILHVGATGFGWMRAMPSLGAIGMGLMLALRPPMRHSGRVLLMAVASFGAATVVFGLSRSFPLSLAALFTLGAADNISVVVRSTVLQLITPDAMRGRVSAVNAIFIGTSNEIGELESGLTAQWLGTTLAVTAGGVMTLVTVSAVSFIWPVLRQLGRLEDIEPAEPEVTIRPQPRSEEEGQLLPAGSPVEERD